MEVKDIKNNWIVRNLLLAVIFVVAVVVATSIFLNLITHHNKVIEVPDFTNLSFAEAAGVASKAGVTVVLQDSMYVRRLKSGVVYDQTPKPGEMVKKGRKIQLVTNTKAPKKIPMPSLVGCSLRQAKAEILRNGLVLGRLSYVRDIATNNVLKQKVGSREVAPGTMVTSGSTVNLVVGLSATDSRTYVPNVVGRQYLRAVDILQENYLNVGRLRFDSTVRNYADSVSAVVYAQSPSVSTSTVPMGSEVTLSLTTDRSKLPASKAGK